MRDREEAPIVSATEAQKSANGQESQQQKHTTPAQRIMPFRTTFVRATDLSPNGERGPWGHASWPGNVTGYLIGSFLKTYHRQGLFVDPMEGSGTSGDVARDLGINYVGLDLHGGFDATNDDLRRRLNGDLAQSIFLHPAYLGMKKYLDDPRDLSSVGLDIDAWTIKMQAVLRNCWKALAPSGHVGVLVGDYQQNGRFYDLAGRVSGIAEKFLVKKIIREQTNVSSNATKYGNIVLTMHETLLVFKKPGAVAEWVAA
jgi:hypothetical protein